MHKVVFFKVQYKHEFGLNTPLNNMMFNMYNVVKLNLAGCKLVYNMDFLQIMYKLQELNVSNCPNMSTASLVRSMPTLGTLREFVCRENDVRVSSWSIFQCVRDLPDIELIDMCDSGVMRPYLARKICWYCTSLKKFYFTTLWSWDTDVTKLSWCVLVKLKYPHVEFTENVIKKAEEFMRECKYVRDHIMLEEWADASNEVNPL